MTTFLDPAKPKALLSACPAYRPSSLTAVTQGGRSLLVKDETARMGLGAFKAVGGVYAVAKLIEKQLGRELLPDEFLSEPVQAVASKMTFVCASAGNHGMSVAAGARLFGAQARIHLAQTVPQGFASRLEAKGAQVVRSGQDYEQSVAAAIEDAAASGAVHLADGSWPGYTEPPRLVMEGYTIIAEEMRDELAAKGQWPTHVYLQAGVGGLAAAMAQSIRSSWDVQPRIIVVEPDAAPCLKNSALAGEVLTVEGPESNMGRLDCKTPSMLALEILAECADDWVTISDTQALEAVQVARELGFASTPSGVAGLAACLADPSASAPLMIVSEGEVDDA